MRLKEALEHIRAQRTPASVALRHVESQASRAQRLFGEGVDTASDPEGIGDFQNRVAQLFQRSGIASLGLKEFRRAPEGLWTGPYPLDGLPGFAPAFFDLIRAKPTLSVIRNLVDAFVFVFPVGRESFAPAADLIAAMLPRLPRLSGYNLGLSEGLFKGEEGAKAMGRLLLTPDPAFALKRVGIEEQYWQSPTDGLVERGYREACFLCLAEGGSRLDSLIAFARLPDQTFRYPASQTQFVDMLLQPWLAKDPPEDLRIQLQRLLIGFFGDPRLYPERWSRVSEALTRLLIKWLTRSSIEEFLSVVDRSYRDDPDGRRKWNYRKAFWLAHFDAGFIDSAWVVFGSRARDVAASIRTIDFGIHDESASSRKSALIMRMGDATFVEWSHDGYCWIWSRAPEGAAPAPGRRRAGLGYPPELYRKRYEAEELRHAPDRVQHHGSDRGGWQDDVSGHIYRLIRRRLNQRDYMPKRRQDRHG